MLIGVLNPTLIDPDLCLKDVDFDSNLISYTYAYDTYAHARKPCSGAYAYMVEISVRYSVYALHCAQHTYYIPIKSGPTDSINYSQ